MKNIIKYKQYVGTVEFSEEDELLYGKVLGIRSLITYEGSTAKELINDFHGAIDDYLASCDQENTVPEKPYRGTFNVRVSSELHQKAAIYAISNNITLNAFVERALEKAVAEM